MRSRGRVLAQAYAFSSSYRTEEDDPLMVDYMDYSTQLSCGYEAFEVRNAAQGFGVDAFRAAMEHMLDLAQYIADLIEAAPDLELMAPVSLTAVCFRIRGATEAAHTAVLAALIEEGTALLGPARLDGRHGIRARVTNHRTTRDDIELILTRLSDIARHHREPVGGDMGDAMEVAL
ncbi:hypothetical protein JBF12_22850 [Streptomyces javensis]|uniref:Amino acid decarboxylase n=2 Tax=Streptomyces javensis TaxID=114698 RepID=A0ABS0REM0_9ACTN|nr:hypothetical protein [Streptomyces javensis]